jgi:AraC-like DNA-binding protein
MVHLVDHSPFTRFLDIMFVKLSLSLSLPLEIVGMVSTYLSGYTRLTPSLLRLEHIAGRRRKKGWIEHTFVHPYAMLITEGGGEVWTSQGSWRFDQPFVIMARPGEHYRYGPVHSWVEMGLCFDLSVWPECLNDFSFAPWELRSPDLVQQYISQCERLLRQPGSAGVADQLDHLAINLLVASRHGDGSVITPGPHQRILALESWLRDHFVETFELREVVRRFGFAEASFRRIWREHFPLSPWQHILDLRTREAQHQLQAHPELTVAEIARRCGFPDQRHFATVYRKRIGRPPRRLSRS